MLPEVIPIISTTVDWNQYLNISRQILQRSISDKVDGSQLQPKSPLAFLATLGNIKDENVSPNDVISNPGYLLKNLFVGFLVVGTTTTLYSILKQSTLTVVDTPTIVSNTHLLIVTGTLDKWREAIINGMSEMSEYEFRLFLGKCLICFERDGLGQIWSEYNKKYLQDKSLILVKKK